MPDNTEFTLLDLLDLALRVPEVGAVNFNLLHSALTSLVMEMGFHDFKPQVPLDDINPSTARMALRMGKTSDPHLLWRQKMSPRSSPPEVVKVVEKTIVRTEIVEKKQPATEEPKHVEVEKATEEEVKESQVTSDVFSTEETETIEPPPMTSPTTETRSREDETSILEQSVSDGEKKETASEQPTGTTEEEESKTAEVEEMDSVKEKQLTQETISPTVDTLSQETSTSLVETSQKATLPSLETLSQETSTPLVETSQKSTSPSLETIQVEAGSQETTSLTAETNQQDDNAMAGEELVSEDGKESKETELEQPKQTTESEDSRTAQIKGEEDDPKKMQSEEEEEELQSELTSAAKTVLDGSSKDAAKVITNALLSELDSSSEDRQPPNLLQEMWRTVNVNKRVDAIEEGINQMTMVVDNVWIKVQELQGGAGDFQEMTETVLQEYLERIVVLESKCNNLTNELLAANEFNKSEIRRLEDIIEGLRSNMGTQNEEMEELRKCLENFATKAELEEKAEELMDELISKTKELKGRVRDLQDQMVPKEEFMELTTRVDTLEDVKVNRDELGKLLEPGFLENFLAEQNNLREKLESLIEEVKELEFALDSLIKRIDEEIMKYIEETFSELRETISSMLEKLNTLDADDINDTFARLEELADSIIKDVDSLKLAQSKMEKDLKASLKKIADLGLLIEKLQQLKADKKRMYELLEGKADIELLQMKLDKTEFAEVMTEVQDNHDRLATQVKINEQEMNEGFINVRHELSFKMYTEDFVVGTEPIRNRIKAIIYEQKKLKELILTNLFPDAPGVTKCFSCKRAANLKGGSGDVFQLSTIHPKNSPLKPVKESPKSSPPFKDPKNPSSSEKVLEDILVIVQEKVDETKPMSGYQKLPEIDDLDSVPIPPADHPRTKDIHMLPVILANARPQVGLQYPKSRKTIDSEIDAYFTTSSKFPTVRGEYTKTNPQQRGLSFQTVKLPVGKKSEVLLESHDKKYYKGAVYSDGRGSNPNAVSETKPTLSLKNGSSAIQNITNLPSKKSPKNDVLPSVVALKGSLHESQPTATEYVPTGKPKNVKSKVISNKP